MEDAPAVDLTPVRSATDLLRRAGEAYESALAQLAAAGADSIQSKTELKELNRLLYTSERILGHEGGLPHREWFKHQIYAPGFYTGYGVKTLPGIREGIEEGDWEAARRYVGIVAEAIDNLATQVDQARETLEALVR